MICETCGMPVARDYGGWAHRLPPMGAAERRKYRHVVRPREDSPMTDDMQRRADEINEEGAREAYAWEASAERYVVIENTPGYMPDDDDPATFDDYRAAVRYMIELVRSSRDFSVEGGADIGGWLDRENGEAFLVDEGRPHDLGRYFSVVVDEG